MTREEFDQYALENDLVVWSKEMSERAFKALEQEPCEEYKRGWHNAIATALKETHNYYTEDGVFKAIQEESLIGVGMSMQEPKTGHWIPVSERLPEENGGYLVTVKQGYVTTALWVGTAEFWNEVTAWMPLPPSYQGK